MSGLEIAVRRLGEMLAVSVAGEFDVSCKSALEQALAEAESGRPPILLVDLSCLEFIDAGGLGLLVEAQRRAATEGRVLALMPGPPQVHMVFCLAGLDKQLDFVNMCEIEEA